MNLQSEISEMVIEKVDIMKFERSSIIIKNNGHLACGKLTWADFVFAGIYDALKYVMQSPELDTKFPAFKKLQDTVYSLPRVKEFADKAPKTDF